MPKVTGLWDPNHRLRSRPSDRTTVASAAWIASHPSHPIVTSDSVRDRNRSSLVFLYADLDSPAVRRL